MRSLRPYNWFEHFIRCFLVYGLYVTLISCDDKNNNGALTILPEQDTTAYTVSYGTLPAPPNWPVDNVLTIEGVKLGRMLFYDPILSKDNSVSCASCHKQQFAFSDPNQFSVGIGGAVGLRQSMGLFNLGWIQNGYFWDGRSSLLRHQVEFPIQDPLEMDESLDNAVQKLMSNPMYQAQFARAFGVTGVSVNNMTLALEQFLLSLVSANAKFDQVGRGEAVFTESERRGRLLFNNDFVPGEITGSGSHCGHCHGTGPTFSDNVDFMNNGLDDDASFADLGRELISGNSRDRARFRVPSLRNIAVTAPYMHDGRFETLEEVLDFYNEGIQESSSANFQILHTQGGLFLSDQDKTDIINFLKTLTDEEFLADERFSSPF